jgi:hypothetical protein
MIRVLSLPFAMVYIALAERLPFELYSTGPDDIYDSKTVIDGARTVYTPVQAVFAMIAHTVHRDELGFVRLQRLDDDRTELQADHNPDCHPAAMYLWDHVLEECAAFVADLRRLPAATGYQRLLVPPIETVVHAQPTQIRRQKGGRKQQDADFQDRTVDKWLHVQKYKQQDVFCEEEGISVGTLRRWLQNREQRAET